MANKDDFLYRYLTRRDAIRLLGTATMAGLLRPPYPAYGETYPEPDGGEPNIIFILTDNIQHDDFGFMNHPFIQTPGLDKLAGEGVVFENVFNTSSLCSPSRASILTGAYAHNHGVKNNHTTWTGQKTTFMPSFLESHRIIFSRTAFCLFEIRGENSFRNAGMLFLRMDISLEYTP